MFVFALAAAAIAICAESFSESARSLYTLDRIFSFYRAVFLAATVAAAALQAGYN